MLVIATLPFPLAVLASFSFYSNGVESGDDAGDDSASEKSAGFWGVKLRKQRYTFFVDRLKIEKTNGKRGAYQRT